MSGADYVCMKYSLQGSAVSTPVSKSLASVAINNFCSFDKEKETTICSNWL